MTQEEKELLIKDLNARLLYEVKVTTTNAAVKIGVISGISIENKISVSTKHADIVFDCTEVKPYLFPLSSMTAEQLYELRELFGFEIEFLSGFIELSSRSTLEYLEMIAIIEWFYKNHFDINGLIPMKLAEDATNLNIY